jgi:RND family efflux transporter MFP subunit
MPRNASSSARRAKLIGVSTLLVGALAGGGVLASSLACGASHASPAAAGTTAPAGEATAASVAPAVAVRTAAPAREPVSHPIRATGTMRAKKEVDLAFLVGGEVSWVGVDVGAHVRRGQVLARIDSTQIAAAATRARAANEKAGRDLNRARALVASGSLASVTLEDATTGESIATADQQEADFALRHGVIVAPDDGVVDARFVEPGEVVASGHPAFRVSGRSRGAVVKVGLADRDLVGLDVGRHARVRLDVAPEAAIDAHVSQIASSSSPESGLFDVEVHVDGSGPAAWRSGMTAKVEIDRTVQPGAVVPVAALVPGDGDAAFVASVAGGRAHKVPVHVVFFEGEHAAVAESLDGVDAVATEGAAALTEGSSVSVAQR